MQFSALYSTALDREIGTDDSTRLFTTGRRKDAINEGILQFADLSECYLKQSTISCSHGVAEYDLLSTVNVPGGDLIRLAKQRPEFRHTDSNAVVRYVTGDTFQRRDIEWLNTYEPGWRASTGGTPTFWYERMDGGRRYFGLYAPPEVTSSETAAVLLPYVARPATLSSDTDVPFTNSTGGTRTDLEPYHLAAVHWAAHKLELLRINEPASQAQMQVFVGYVERFVRAMQPKGLKTVKLARSYFAEQRGKRSHTDGPIAPWWR